MIVWRVQDAQVLMAARSGKYLGPGEYATELEATLELRHRLIKAHAAAGRHLETVYRDLTRVSEDVETLMAQAREAAAQSVAPGALPQGAD